MPSRYPARAGRSRPAPGRRPGPSRRPPSRPPNRRDPRPAQPPRKPPVPRQPASSPPATHPPFPKGWDNTASKLARVGKWAIRRWWPIALLPFLWADDPDRRDENATYDWSGWQVVNMCAYPLGIPRRWSESLAAACLINQAVNYPAIRPQDNYAALAFDYEAFPGIQRLVNTVNFERIRVGEVLPWEDPAGASPPRIWPIAAPQLPVIPALGIHPVPMSTPVLPLPVPHFVVPSLPSLSPEGHPIRFYAPPALPPLAPPLVPGTPPVIEVPLVPGAQPNPVPGPAHSFNPPRGRVKERKVRVTFLGLNVVMRVVNGVSEIPDYVDALYSALPKRCKLRPKRIQPGDPEYGQRYENRYWVQSRAAAGKSLLRTHRAPSTDEKLTAIYRCWDHIDVRKALIALVDNEIEDRAYGKLGKATGKASGKLGLTFGVESGPAI